MTLRNLIYLIFFLFSSCGFPSRNMTNNLSILKPKFADIYTAILNEKVDSTILPETKMRIPHYSKDSTIRQLLTKARVHNYDIIDSNKIVRLDWPDEKHSYSIFISIKNKQLLQHMQCEEKCKSLWLGDSVLLQRHYTPLVFIY